MTPLLTRVYPNGKADVNHFHAAGGMGFLIRELAAGGPAAPGRHHSWGGGLDAYTPEPRLAADGALQLARGRAGQRRHRRAAPGCGSRSSHPAG